MAIVIPGVLTNDEQDYVVRLKKAESASVIVQIDIIDGKFAPNTTVGVDVVGKYPSQSKLEVQLIVRDPSDHIAKLINLDFVSRILFPLEAGDPQNNIKTVKGANKQVGLSVNPETEITQVSNWARDIDLLCIFSASPGFSGKQLEETVYSRILESKKLFPELAVEVDIGVNLETAPKLVESGSDYLVATSALINAPNYQVAYDQLAQVVAAAS